MTILKRHGPRRFIYGISMAFFLFTLSVYTGAACAGEISFNSALSGVKFRTQVESAAELQLKDVVRQKLDISCGSAALATILRFYYGDIVSEDEIINEMVNGRTREEIVQGKGFSLLELKKAAEKLGYKAHGLKGNIEALKYIRVPVIVLLDSDKFPHFVVARGVVDGRVALADPAVGNITIGIEDFLSRWNGVFLAIEGNGKGTQNDFAVEQYMPPIAPGSGTVNRFLESSLKNYPFDPMEF
ncbi:MAG: C39 family peptidase [Firmicutes bacterium]|nr:C39 family peptidase [Bacillota bacterium]